MTGSGYAPEGQLLVGDTEISIDAAPDVRQLLEAMILCNDAQVLGPDDDAEVDLKCERSEAAHTVAVPGPVNAATFW